MRAWCMLYNTAVRSLSSNCSQCPKYLKSGTVSISVPLTMNLVASMECRCVCSCWNTDRIRPRSHSADCRWRSVVWHCDPHHWHLGKCPSWMLEMSFVWCRCWKCLRMPSHPLIGTLQYGMGHWAYAFRSGVRLMKSRPSWLFGFVVGAKVAMPGRSRCTVSMWFLRLPWFIEFPHVGQLVSCMARSWKESPMPVMQWLYDSCEICVVGVGGC